MIFEATIHSINNNKIEVKIPLYNNEIYTISKMSTMPGISYSMIKKGTNVLICFLNNNLANPVIVGVVSKSDNINGVANIVTTTNELNVLKKATLPSETTIDGSNLVTRKEFEDSIDKILNYLNTCLSGGN